MKYKAIRDVIIDGTPHKAGSVIDINHSLTDRLVLLGYIEKFDGKEEKPVDTDFADEPPKEDRAVKPSKKRSK